MRLNRRAVIIGGGCAIAAAALPWRRLLDRGSPTSNAGGFGPLTPDPEGIFDLPAGFSHQVLQRKYEPMSDGYRVPGSFDGMACFDGPNDTLVLMRNHENTWLAAQGAYGGAPPPSEAYDPAAYGAVTRVVLRRDDLSVVSSNLVLCGTLRNCAGGPSPWGWLSCEEATDPTHGYVFLCATDADRVRPPRKIGGYGRFRHEAVAIDPETHVAYLTEDQPDGCLYRFGPANRDEPFVGRLQCMKAVGRDLLQTRRGLKTGETFEVEWADIRDRSPKDDTVRREAHTRGAAVFERGEGIWYDEGQIVFASTNGGPVGAGQIFRLTIGKNGARDRCEIVAQSTRRSELDMPDNVCVGPNGEVVIAEDSIGGDQFVRVLTPDGQIFDLGRNALSQSEVAGVCFSSDGETLFVNIYGDGLTLAVRGPFRS